jgi:hypothetical protein
MTHLALRLTTRSEARNTQRHALRLTARSEAMTHLALRGLTTEVRSKEHTTSCFTSNSEVRSNDSSCFMSNSEVRSKEHTTSCFTSNSEVRSNDSSCFTSNSEVRSKEYIYSPFQGGSFRTIPSLSRKCSNFTRDRGLVITSATCSSVLMYWSFKAPLCTMSWMK